MLGLGRTMGMMALCRTAKLSRNSPSPLSSRRVSMARVSSQAGRPSAMKLLSDACTCSHASTSATHGTRTCFLSAALSRISGCTAVSQA